MNARVHIGTRLTLIAHAQHLPLLRTHAPAPFPLNGPGASAFLPTAA